MDGHLRLPQSPMEADTGETGDSLFVNSLARRPWFGGWQLASSATDRHPTQAISSIVRRKSNLFPITLAKTSTPAASGLAVHQKHICTYCSLVLLRDRRWVCEVAHHSWR